MFISQPTFLPNRINKSLSLAFAGDRSAKTFNGGNISVWGNWSGTGNDATQATAANQGLFVASMINGLPGIDFTAFDFMDMAAGVMGTGNGKYTFFAVLENVPSGGSFILGGGTAGVDTQLFFRNNAGTFNTGWFSNNLIAGTLTAATFHLLTSSYDQAGRVHHIDGTNVGSDSATTKNLDGAAACTIGLNTSGINMQIAEIHFFLDELTATELGFMFNYLGKKYNITVP